jgi:hypothetical protein
MLYISSYTYNRRSSPQKKKVKYPNIQVSKYCGYFYNDDTYIIVEMQKFILSCNGTKLEYETKKQLLLRQEGKPEPQSAQTDQSASQSVGSGQTPP